MPFEPFSRRKFITLLGGAAAWPSVSHAQQPAKPVIGFLGRASPIQYASFAAGFHRGLNETGYVEGRNVAVEYRWADTQYDRLPALAADLVAHKVDVIFTGGSTPATLAAKAATETIPIVFFVGGDPAEMGLVTSLSRPGGNLTGVTNLAVEVGPKRLELLHEVVPGASSIALLVNPASPAQAEPQTHELQAAAQKLGLQLHVLHARTELEIDAAFATIVQLRAGGLVIGPDVLFNGVTRSQQLAALALRYRVPTIYQYPEFTAAGGLMSYGSNLVEMFRLTGVYVGRILNGEKPADLPVQRTTTVELIINMKTAKALDLSVPLMLLGRADEVVE
jgi:putative tryptophan/tyrosine transport system substrate-binding protein